MKLEEILEVVKLKYKDAYIENKDIIRFKKIDINDYEFAIYFDDRKNKYKFCDCCEVINCFENIIELKQALDIEITFEDICVLLPYIAIERDSFTKGKFFSFKGYTYNDEGYVFRNDTEEQILYDLSFKKQINIIKNLIEE